MSSYRTIRLEQEKTLSPEKNPFHLFHDKDPWIVLFGDPLFL